MHVLKLHIWRLETSCYIVISNVSYSSKRAHDRVSEAKYPVLCGSDSPVVLGKIKRIKSMQPKPLEDEITKSLGEANFISDVK